MKKILVPLSTMFFNPFFPIYGEYATYIWKLKKYNLLPLFVLPVMSSEMIDYLYNLSDGLYLTGGSDVDPLLYGKKRHIKTKPNEKERDRLEISLIKRFVHDKKPILAICRGAEVLAVANGGSLIQHIPDVVKDEIHSQKREHDYDPKVKKHKAILDKKSRAYKFLKKDVIMVNSLHHQAVENPGKNLRIVGRSPEGIAEVIEHANPKYFCIGVQSHPETEDRSFFEPLFKEFAKAAAK